MSFWGFIPAPPPGPPIPLRLPLAQEESTEEETPEPPKGEARIPSVGDSRRPLEERFKRELGGEGYDGELVEMGVKVMRNHLRTEEEAFEIGRNYVREMAK